MHRHFRVLLCLTGLAVAMAAQGGAASPLSFQIGGMQFSPGGFMDFTTVFRSTNVGSGIGTNFAGIPYNNTTAGQLTEFRESAQNSRLALKVSGDRGDTAFFGYVETDFLGNQSTNVEVSSNSTTMRMRVYFVDVRNGAWEILAGQDWSMLTPNRVGLSPMPGDIFYSQNMDTNYQVGLTWSRQPQFRVMYHASPNFTAGLSIENNAPYIGGSSGAPLVTLPGGAGGVYGGQVNNGSSSFSSPNFSPDIIVKAAYDSAPNGQGIHLEIGALESEFRILTPATGVTSKAAGGGLMANAIGAVTPSLKLIATSFFSDGGGRYFFGMAPNLIIRQDGTVSTVRSDGGILGFEAQVDPANLFYGYYGGVYIRPDYDLSGATPVGYAYPGAANSMNKAIQEGTVGIIHTFWKSNNYGALQLITQASYLTRNPWTVAAGAPKNAHTAMGFADLRFTLP